MDLSKLAKEIEKLSQKQTKQTIELQTLVGSKFEEAQTKLQKFEKVESTLHQIGDSLTTLTKTVTITHDLSSKVFGKVGTVDLAQSRVISVSKKLKDLLALKTCKVGLEEALANNELREACRLYLRFLQVDQSIINERLNQKFQSLGNTLITNLREMYENESSINKLNRKVNASQNVNLILQVTELFAIVNQHHEALNKLSKYVRTCIALRSNENYKLLVRKSKNMDNESEKEKEKQGQRQNTKGFNKTTEHDENETLIFLNNLIDLFDDSASVILRLESFFAEHFVPGSSIILLRNVQQQVDIQAQKLIKLFQSSREIDNIIQQLSILNSAKEITPLLDELAMIIKQGEMFDKFLRKKARSSFEQAQQNPKLWDWLQGIIHKPVQLDLTSTIDESKQTTKERKLKEKRTRHHNYQYGLIQNSEMNVLIQELTSNYISLEEFYMINSITRVLDMYLAKSNKNNNNFDFLNTDFMNISLKNSSTNSSSGSINNKEGLNKNYLSDNNSNSDNEKNENIINENEKQMGLIVEDIFYLITKSVFRAFNSNNVFALIAILNHISTIFKSLIQNSFEGRISKISWSDLKVKEGNEILELVESGQITLNEMPQYKSQVKYINSEPFIALNDLAQTIDYLKKFKRDLHGQCIKSFNSNPKELTLLESSVTGIEEEIKSLQNLLLESQNLLLKTMQAKLKSLIENFIPINYDINDTQFKEYSVNDPFSFHFILKLTKILSSLKVLLIESNFEAILKGIISYVARSFEVYLKRKQFSLLGGLQFEKDLRVISNFFSNCSKNSARIYFSKLSQIAYILTHQSVNEFFNFYKDKNNNMNWKLSYQDIRKILSLRNDFNNDEINKLNL
ncbi:conserved oligomeric golgi complex subunit [Anaeramoeba flamelloides]|uniref:Conserved oligomeric Golgi complex subunit 4 n=1 Tax=Anaeramoeba flamelloides TaxID=1746091 RepID=A0AAV8A4Y3_9EUKA|nr:conserved oligomeric golgi complex subunit [Anaeramoeba flamelloides]